MSGVCANRPAASVAAGIPKNAQDSARTVLLRILGDLVYPTDEPVPTAALLTVLSDAGFSAHAARQAVSRCARMGILEGQRHGRHVHWLLTGAGQDLMADGRAMARQLGQEPKPWTGSWLVVIVSVPHERRVIRQKLYRSLAWAGCGSPVPGIWITAHPERREWISAALSRVALEQTTVSFVGRASGIGLSDLELVAGAWDLDAVGRDYRVAADRFDAAPEPVTGSAAVVLLLQVDQVLQRMVSSDPWLPRDLCPGWSGRTDAARLLAYRDALLVPARDYWTELLQR